MGNEKADGRVRIMVMLRMPLERLNGTISDLKSLRPTLIEVDESSVNGQWVLTQLEHSFAGSGITRVSGAGKAPSSVFPSVDSFPNWFKPCLDTDAVKRQTAEAVENTRRNIEMQRNAMKNAMANMPIGPVVSDDGLKLLRPEPAPYSMPLDIHTRVAALEKRVEECGTLAKYLHGDKDNKFIDAFERIGALEKRLKQLELDAGPINANAPASTQNGVSGPPLTLLDLLQTEREQLQKAKLELALTRDERGELERLRERDKASQNAKPYKPGFVDD